MLRNTTKVNTVLVRVKKTTLKLSPLIFGINMVECYFKEGEEN